MPSILIVEDDPFQRKALAKMLRTLFDYDIKGVEDGPSTLAFLKTAHLQDVLLIILDLGLPGMHGIELLDILRHDYPQIPVIILSATESQREASIALRKGATDFINKPPQKERLTVSIENAICLHRLSDEVEKLRSVSPVQGLTFETLIGADTGLQDVVIEAKRAAQTNIAVLLMGETGVGKEVFARAIHAGSARAAGPFVAINCGAIPKQLVESVLFGHEKGAFTGAISDAIGKFREADGGTLFLDEVGELPLDAQVKLLRTLQQGDVEPVGGRKPVPVDVRIVSATNRDLAHEVSLGQFREDLFYRLEGLPLTLPPLRARVDDIGPLAQYFLTFYSQQEHVPIKVLSEAGLSFLKQQPWPGNVRELQHTLHRTLILSPADIIEAEDIAASLVHKGEGAVAAIQPEQSGGKRVEVLRENGDVVPLDDVVEAAVKLVLNAYEGNVTEASYKLGVAKSTFYRKWKHLL